MRIGIDARFYGPIGKGLGRYTQKLIENLEKIDDENLYFVYLRKENFDDYKPRKKNFKKILADFKWYTWEEQIKFPWLLRKYKLDLVHFPHFNVPIFYPGKFVVTIHDLILLHFPTRRSSTLSPLVYSIKFLFYKIIIKAAVMRSTKLITVSNFTKKDILENYPKVSEEKIRVTHEACDDYCMLTPKKDEEILEKYGIIKPYIMYVGNAYPHKNLERLVLAYEKAKEIKKDLKLIFVGNQDYFYLRLREMCEKRKVKDIIFVGFVPDYELDTIFRNVAVFMWPSLYEGFGLPPLEAMAKGTPVASSDHPCMKEVLEDSAYFFKGEDIEDMKEAIIKVIDDEKLRSELIKKGYEQIRKYSWKRMAHETLEIYENAGNFQIK